MLIKRKIHLWQDTNFQIIKCRRKNTQNHSIIIFNTNTTNGTNVWFDDAQGKTCRNLGIKNFDMHYDVLIDIESKGTFSTCCMHITLFKKNQRYRNKEVKNENEDFFFKCLNLHFFIKFLKFCFIMLFSFGTTLPSERLNSTRGYIIILF